MTGLHAATYRTEPLPVARLEWLAALFAVCRWSMPCPGVVKPNRTRAASFRASRRFGAAIGAMLGVLRRCAKPSAVYLFVARNAQRQAVVYVSHQFGVVCNWLDVVSVKIAARTAVLASEVIALVDCKTPFCKIAHRCGTFAAERLSTLPGGGSFPRFMLSGARSGTVDGRLVFGREHCSALWTLARRCWASARPARFGAEFGSVSAVCLDTEIGTAHSASLCYLGVLHGCIISHNTQNEKKYVAVALERWATMTGQSPVLLDITG